MSNIAVHRDGDSLTLVFSRPEAANAFGLDDALQLRKILKANPTARVLVWRSAGGRCFCAGGDLAAYARMAKRDQGLAANRKIAAALKDLAAFPGLTLAIVEGDCWGGGLELLSSFDTVWALPHAAFGLWQRRIGLSFGWGGGTRLEARLGPAKVKALALTARSFTAATAADLGLVDRVVSPASLEAALGVWMKQQLSLPPEPLPLVKAMTPKSEADVFRRLWWNASHRRVLARFKGRGGRV